MSTKQVSAYGTPPRVRDLSSRDTLGKDSAQPAQDRFSPENVAQYRGRVNSVLQRYSDRRRAYERGRCLGSGPDMLRLACEKQDIRHGSAVAKLQHAWPCQVHITARTAHAQSAGPETAGTLCPQQEGDVQAGRRHARPEVASDGPRPPALRSSRVKDLKFSLAMRAASGWAVLARQAPKPANAFAKMASRTRFAATLETSARRKPHRGHGAGEAQALRPACGGRYTQGIGAPVLGGGVTVTRQTLDLFIGVRIPASQPTFASIAAATGDGAGSEALPVARRLMANAVLSNPKMSLKGAGQKK